MNTSFEELETIAYQTYEQGNLKDAFELFMTLATDHHDSDAMSQIACMYSRRNIKVLQGKRVKIAQVVH